MLTTISIRKMGLAAVVVSLGALWLAGGCESQENKPSRASGEAPSQAPILASASPKGGAQLWSENCGRCHNFRPPQYYSDAQWDVSVHHMRLRANLTGDEARTITKFLQSSN